MAFPKKHSKLIDVDGVRYRYNWSWSCIQDPATVIIEHAENPASKLWASFDGDLIQDQYAQAGKTLSRERDPIGGPPFVLRQTILLGLSRGWRPGARGPTLHMEDITSTIDFSLLKPRK